MHPPIFTDINCQTSTPPTEDILKGMSTHDDARNGADDGDVSRYSSHCQRRL